MIIHNTIRFGYENLDVVNVRVKKFKYKTLKNLLIEIADKAVAEQKVILDHFWTSL